MKQTLTIFLSLLLAGICFGQNPNKKITIADIKTHLPIQGVNCIYNDIIIWSSLEDGTCYLNSEIYSEIALEHRDYNRSDTLITSNLQTGDTIFISPFDISIEYDNYDYLLKETKIKGKYKPKKHIKNLIQFNRDSLYNKEDSSTKYYTIESETYIPCLNSIEYFEGVIEIIYTKHSTRPIINYIKINEYKNTIADNIYKELYHSSITLLIGSDVLLSCFQCGASVIWKNYEISNIYSKNNKKIFLSSFNKRKKVGNFTICFNGNTLDYHTRHFCFSKGLTIPPLSENCLISRNEIMKYSMSESIYLNEITTSDEFILQDSIEYINTIRIKECDFNTYNAECNLSEYFSNNKELYKAYLKRKRKQKKKKNNASTQLHN